MAARIGRLSRLQFADYLVDGVEFFDLPQYPPELRVAREGDQYHAVQDGDRLDLIATRYYGDPLLGWVIAVANDLDDPIADVVADTVLRIPSDNYLRGELFGSRRGRS